MVLCGRWRFIRVLVSFRFVRFRFISFGQSSSGRQEVVHIVQRLWSLHCLPASVRASERLCTSLFVTNLLTLPAFVAMAASTDLKSTKGETLVVGQPDVQVKKKSKKSKDGKSKDSAEKSSKKKRKTTEAAAAATTDEQPKKKKKKSKTDSVHSSSDSEDTTVAAEAPVAATPVLEPVAPANPLALDNFRLSAPIKSLLRAKNMDSLFDIQAQTLNFLLDGFDLVGRARTGCGKTLAFVLPIIERLSQGYDGSKRAFGRGPKVIVLAPTRELAKQVCCRRACPVDCNSLQHAVQAQTVASPSLMQHVPPHRQLGLIVLCIAAHVHLAAAVASALQKVGLQCNWA